MKKETLVSKLPFIIFILVLVPAIAVSFYITKDLSEEEEDPSQQESSTIVERYEDTIPVITENNYIRSPYIDGEVQVGKSFYDYQGEEEAQEKSIVVQENTYYQNTGIDYVKETIFDVVSIANGTVTMVKEDDLVGKVIEIEHNNGLISIYQSLSETFVQKGDQVAQGQVLGRSGNNEMDKELGNHLHFEIYENGNSVNPEYYINKEYKKGN